MFRNLFRRLVGVGLALCILGATVLVTPGFGMADNSGVTPFGILDPVYEPDL